MDFIFYKNFYDDLKKLTDNKLIEHYNKHGINENRIINTEQLEDLLTNTFFNPEFYLRFRKIKIPNNCYNHLFIFKEFLKYNDFRNDNELREYLILRIDLDFFQKIYKTNDLIKIFYLTQEKNLFYNENEMKCFLDYNKLDFSKYKSKYNLNMDEKDIIEHYFINNLNLKLNFGWINLKNNSKRFYKLKENILLNFLDQEIYRNKLFIENEVNPKFKDDNLKFYEINRHIEKYKIEYIIDTLFLICNYTDIDDILKNIYDLDFNFIYDTNIILKNLDYYFKQKNEIAPYIQKNIDLIKNNIECNFLNFENEIYIYLNQEEKKLLNIIKSIYNSNKFHPDKLDASFVKYFYNLDSPNILKDDTYEIKNIQIMKKKNNRVKF